MTRPAAIRDHAFLSDCRTATLVTRDGVVDWWPAPRFDSPSAFSALLDPDAGHWSLRPDAWHPERAAHTGAFGSDHLDAGVLLMPLVGLLDAAEPRMRRTIAALEDELGDDGLLRRWTGAEDGPFLLASFWLSQCHAAAGELEAERAGGRAAA